MAQATLKFVPPLIRNSLIGESTFRQEYGFQTEAVIALGDSGLSIQRAELFDAVRTVLAGATEVEVTDADGRRWQLRNDHQPSAAERQLAEERKRAAQAAQN